jgi:hypothetical protein
VAIAVDGGAAWYFLAGPGRGGHVAVTVTTEPAGATVFDGERLVGATPIVVQLPRDGAPHTLIVKRDGYLTAERVVSGKDDRALKLRLTPKPVEEPEEPPPPAPPPKPVAVATPPPPKAVAKAAAKAEPPKPVAPKKHHARPPKEDTLILTPSF